MSRHGNFTEALMIRIEPELRTELERYAANEERSLADVVRRLLRKGLREAKK